MLAVEGVIFRSESAFELRDEVEVMKARLIETLNWLPVAAYAISPRGELVAWNRQMADIWGFSPNEVFGSLEQCALNAWLQKTVSSQDKQHADRQTIDHDITWMQPNGENLIVSLRSETVYFDSGDVFAVVNCCENITERRRSECEKDNIEGENEHILQSLADGYFRLDRNWRFTKVNGKAERILGLSAQDILGRAIWSALPGSVGSDFQLHYERAFLEQVSVRFESYHAILDRYYEVLAVPTPVSLSVFFTDVTERVKGAERQRLLTELMPVMVWRSDPSGIPDFFNRRWSSYTGCSLAPLHETPRLALDLWVSIIHTEDLESAGDLWRRSIESGEEFRTELRLRRSDGEFRWHLIRALPLRDERGRIMEWVGSCTDVHDLKCVEEALVASEKRFRQLADSMPQIVWTAQPDGYLDYYNERWYEFTGFDRHDGGTSWFPIMPAADAKRCREAWDQVVRSGKPYQIEYRFWDRRTCEYRWYLGRALPVRDEDGKIVKWFGTCTDIHEQKMIEEELRRARDAAESANYLKSAFVANMSHEVRTPLGVILGFADLLADPTTTQEERRSYNEILKRNGEQLSVIINDILDLSKVEAGQLSIEVEEFSVESLVDEVIDSFSMRAIEKGIQVRAEFIGSWPVDFAGDMIRIRQVLMNLVSNAVKFTHKGEVVVRVREEEGDLVIEVSDTGVGIAPEKQAKLFCAFSQADESITRKYGGTGLGLALSLKLAQLMKGSLVLGGSTVGSGSVFKLRLSPLPLTQTCVAASDLISLPASSTQITPSSLSGLRVLLVDDSIDNQFIIGRILRKNEAVVETANNGLEGIERALAGQFDVVLMDIQMPVLDGYSAVMRLKERGYDRPIIALTAHALTEMRRKCLAIGCCAHLTKPIEPDILIATVAEFARMPAIETGLRLVERVQA